jgi:hypothetical protein
MIHHPATQVSHPATAKKETYGDYKLSRTLPVICCSSRKQQQDLYSLRWVGTAQHAEHRRTVGSPRFSAFLHPVTVAAAHVWN